MNLKNYISALQQTGDKPSTTWRFSSWPFDLQSSDNRASVENPVRWQYIENMRYRFDGNRQDLRFRDGAETVYSPIAGTVVQVTGFTGTLNGVSKRYLFIKTNTGRIVIWDPESDTAVFEETTLAFANSNRVDIHAVQEYLYIFDGQAQSYKYISLEKGEMYNWLNAERPAMGEPQSGFTANEGTLEENIWGFKKGATVIACPQSNLPLVPVDPAKGWLEPNVYEYEYNEGTHIIINGDPVLKNTVLTITGGTSYSVGGSGANFSLWISPAMILDGDATTSPVTGTIDTITDLGNTFIVETRSQNKKRYYCNFDSCLLLPHTPDLESYIGSSGPYQVGGDSVTATPDYETPTLHRSYIAVYRLNDGSYTLPGQPVDISVDAADIFTGNTLAISSVHLQQSILAQAPANAEKLLLFCTRWQATLGNCYRADEDYPNGPYYFAKEHAPETTDITDTTPDSALLTPLSAFIPMAGGTFNIFGNDQIAPTHVTSFKNGVLFANYTLRRSDISSYVKNVNTGSTLPATMEIRVQAEYTDNTHSQVTSFTTFKGIRLFGVNAIIRAFTIYLVKDVGEATETIHEVKRVGPGDEAFYGKVIDIDTAATFPEKEIHPAGPDLTLPGAAVAAFPPQMIDISEQKLIPDAPEIRGVKVQGMDADRGIQVRYRVAFFTDDAPISGLLYSQISDNTATLQFDTEPTNRSLPLFSKHSLLNIGNGTLFQSRRGIWLLQGNQSQKIIDADQYPDLVNPVLETIYNPLWNEVWLLCNNNTVLVWALKEAGGEVSTPTIYRFTWPFTNTIRSLGTAINSVYAASAGNIVKIENTGQQNDQGQDIITARLRSVPVSPFNTQVHIHDVELYGQHIQAGIDIDLQETRFDDEETPDNWLPEFNSDLNVIPYPVDQRGTPLGIYARGIAPRLQITATQTPGKTGRLTAVEMTGTISNHQSAKRK